MATTEGGPIRGTEFEVRWNQTSFRRNLVVLVVLFLVYVTITVLASGAFRLIGIAGTIVFGVIVLYTGVTGLRQLRQRPVAVALDDVGVTFDRHDPVAWDAFREVRLSLVKPRLLFVLHPLYYIVFLPKRSDGIPSATARERLAARIYGTPFVLMTQTVTPSGDAILAAVERLSDVPVRR